MYKRGEGGRSLHVYKRETRYLGKQPHCWASANLATIPSDSHLSVHILPQIRLICTWDRWRPICKKSRGRDWPFWPSALDTHVATRGPKWPMTRLGKKGDFCELGRQLNWRDGPRPRIIVMDDPHGLGRPSWVIAHPQSNFRAVLKKFLIGVLWWGNTFEKRKKKCKNSPSSGRIANGPKWAINHAELMARWVRIKMRHLEIFRGLDNV